MVFQTKYQVFQVFPEANILDSSPDRSRGMNSTFLEIWEAIVPISSQISNLFKFWAQVKGIQVDFSIYSIKYLKLLLETETTVTIRNMRYNSEICLNF